MEYEIFAELVVFSQLSPFDLAPLFSSLARTHRLLTVEEGTLTLGWGAEVAARAAEAGIDGLRVRRVSGVGFADRQFKAAPKRLFLPSQASITKAALELVNHD